MLAMHSGEWGRERGPIQPPAGPGFVAFVVIFDNPRVNSHDLANKAIAERRNAICTELSTCPRELLAPRPRSMGDQLLPGHPLRRTAS
jgi:hypothetical protein